MKGGSPGREPDLRPRRKKRVSGVRSMQLGYPIWADGFHAGAGSQSASPGRDPVGRAESDARVKITALWAALLHHQAALRRQPRRATQRLRPKTDGSGDGYRSIHEPEGSRWPSRRRNGARSCTESVARGAFQRGSRLTGVGPLIDSISLKKDAISRGSAVFGERESWRQRTENDASRQGPPGCRERESDA
jgi:hypothetical protein